MGGSCNKLSINVQPLIMPKRKTVHDKDNSSKPSIVLSDFARLYGTALFRVCYLWTFNNGRDGDWPPPRHMLCSKNDEWRMLFQPKRTDEHDDSPSFAEAALIFSRVDKAMIDNHEQDVELIHSLIIKSFKTLMKQTGNKWFVELSTDERKDVNTILNITSPLTLTPNGKALKMSFQYAGCENSDFDQYWYPRQLGESLGIDNALDTEEPVLLPYRHRCRSSQEEMESWMTDGIGEVLARIAGQP